MAIECDVCCKKMSDHDSLTKHMKVHDDVVSHFCDNCSKGFKFKTSLIRHLGKAHRKYFYCVKCFRSFDDKFQFDEHNNVVVEPPSAPVPFWNPNPNKLQCKVCLSIFDSLCNLNVHYTECHVNGFKPYQGHGGVGGSQTGGGQGGHGGHGHGPSQGQGGGGAGGGGGGGGQSSHSGGGGAPHQRQDQYYMNSVGLASAGTSRAGGRSKVSDIGIKVGGFVKEYKCGICSKTFYREAYIVAHHKLVHPHSPWNCNVCSKIFKNRSRLKRHEMTVHEEGRPFTCHVCQKSFRHPDILKVHHQTHLEVKRHRCKICPSSASASSANSNLITSFASTRGLRRHMAKHHSGA